MEWVSVSPTLDVDRVTKYLSDTLQRSPIQKALAHRLCSQVDPDTSSCRLTLSLLTKYPLCTVDARRIVGVMGLHLFTEVIAEYVALFPRDVVVETILSKSLVDPLLLGNVVLSLAKRKADKDILDVVDQVGDLNILVVEAVILVLLRSSKNAFRAVEILNQVHKSMLEDLLLERYAGPVLDSITNLPEDIRFRDLVVLAHFSLFLRNSHFEPMNEVVKRYLENTLDVGIIFSDKLIHRVSENHIYSYLNSLQYTPSYFWKIAAFLLGSREAEVLSFILETLVPPSCTWLKPEDSIVFILKLDHLASREDLIVHLFRFVIPTIVDLDEQLLKIISDIVSYSEPLSRIVCTVADSCFDCALFRILVGAMLFRPRHFPGLKIFLKGVLLKDFSDRGPNKLVAEVRNVLSPKFRKQIYDECLVPGLRNIGFIVNSNPLELDYIRLVDKISNWSDSKIAWSNFIKYSSGYDLLFALVLFQPDKDKELIEDKGIKVAVFLNSIACCIFSQREDESLEFSQRLYACVANVVALLERQSYKYHHGLDLKIIVWSLWYSSFAAQLEENTIIGLVELFIGCCAKSPNISADKIDLLLDWLFNTSKDNHHIRCECPICLSLSKWKHALLLNLFFMFDEIVDSKMNELILKYWTNKLRIPSVFGFFFKETEAFINNNSGAGTLISLILLCRTSASNVECHTASKVVDMLLKKTKITTQLESSRFYSCLLLKCLEMARVSPSISHIVKALFVTRNKVPRDTMLLRAGGIMLICQATVCNAEWNLVQVDILYEFVASLSRHFTFLTSGSSFAVETRAVGELICAASACLLIHALHIGCKDEYFQEAFTHYESALTMVLVESPTCIWSDAFDKTSHQLVLLALEEPMLFAQQSNGSVFLSQCFSIMKQSSIWNDVVERSASTQVVGFKTRLI